MVQSTTTRTSLNNDSSLIKMGYLTRDSIDNAKVIARLGTRQEELLLGRIQPGYTLLDIAVSKHGTHLLYMQHRNNDGYEARVVKVSTQGRTTLESEEKNIERILLLDNNPISTSYDGSASRFYVNGKQMEKKVHGAVVAVDSGFFISADENTLYLTGPEESQTEFAGNHIALKDRTLYLHEGQEISKVQLMQGQDFEQDNTWKKQSGLLMPEGFLDSLLPGQSLYTKTSEGYFVKMLTTLTSKHLEGLLTARRL